MKQIRLSTSIGMTALLCSVTFTGTVFFMQYRNQKLQEKYQRLSELDSFVQENYYTEYDNHELINTMLKGYVAGLGDRYSQYMTPEEYSALKTREAGKTVGIGVTVLQNEEGYPLIIEVQKNSPAENAGLKPEDVILSIDGEDILTMDYEEAINRIKGEENTKVTLTVRHDGEEKEVPIIRKSFDMITAGGDMLDGHIGYIYITNFRENTADQFLTVLNDLISQGADALLFDVRNDGGGLLSAL
jgi:carboxyl-terminal processing protease